MINTILGSLSTLFNLDNNPQVPKAVTQPGQTPEIELPDYLSTQQHISTIAPGAEQWGRKEWRQWRKQQGLSKQEMRNIRAQALVGTQAPHDVSRGDLKRIERNVKAQTPGMALYAVSGRDAGRKVNQVTDILGDIASRWDGKTPMQVKNVPIEIEEEIIEEEPLPVQSVQPVSPITYNWGNTVNSYWQGQNEKVLNSLSDEERRKIAGDDGIITADEAKAWLTGMGLSGDLKFGTGTIGAASAKYGSNFNASGFKGYTNPVKVINPKKVDNGTPATTGFKAIGNSGDHYMDIVNSMDGFWADDGWEEAFKLAYTRDTGSSSYNGDAYNKAKQNFLNNYLKKYYKETGAWFGDSWVRK